VDDVNIRYIFSTLSPAKNFRDIQCAHTERLMVAATECVSLQARVLCDRVWGHHWMYEGFTDAGAICVLPWWVCVDGRH